MGFIPDVDSRLISGKRARTLIPAYNQKSDA